MAEHVSLLAGKPVTPGMLINVPRLVTAALSTCRTAGERVAMVA